MLPSPWLFDSFKLDSLPIGWRCALWMPLPNGAVIDSNPGILVAFPTVETIKWLQPDVFLICHKAPACRGKDCINVLGPSLKKPRDHRRLFIHVFVSDWPLSSHRSSRAVAQILFAVCFSMLPKERVQSILDVTVHYPCAAGREDMVHELADTLTSSISFRMGLKTAFDAHDLTDGLELQMLQETQSPFV